MSFVRKIKILILIGCVFLLSGCSVEYNLTIDNTTMEEDIDVIFDKTTESELANRLARIRRTSYYNFDTRENEYYTFSRRDTDNNIILNYKYQYLNNDLYKSEAVSRCYYKRIVNVTDDDITLSTDNQVACLYKDGERQIDDITVNIKTDLIVLENNADEVNGNVYTWYINDQNYSNKSLYIKMEKNKYQESFIDKVISIVIIILVIVVIGLFIYFIVRRKHLKNNKIK